MTEYISRRDRILVVDDTPDSLRFLVDMLDQEGMTPLVATSGEAALDLLCHTVPDLVLMDAVMPGLDGFETTARIKRDPALAHLPVIFMTGLSEPQHAIMALECGGVDYVRKPVVLDELMARIRVHLANARMSHRSQRALDVAGRHVLALDSEATLLWCTPQAESLLLLVDPAWSSAQSRLPDGLRAAAARLLHDPAGPGRSIRAPFDTFEIELATMEGTRGSERGESGEILVRLTEIREGAEAALLQKQAALTPREAEVLLWVTRGKSNRTISEILEISPRTVNKHLQQVFTKLGVETRAAATAHAMRILAG
ncbi:response regulator [Croceicoccus sp. YJ47]|uniref:response regulator transcription factor n=1 Tax=Croceicoccus sp. YJ47 TaxID=2798724 RepID=UPI001923D56B|nr:response regulator [Croceicoccus sp. YJ47]QQN73730.1 response regulator [Croceicoccus sp. YJ47]